MSTITIVAPQLRSERKLFLRRHKIRQLASRGGAGSEADIAHLRRRWSLPK